MTAADPALSAPPPAPPPRRRYRRRVKLLATGLSLLLLALVGEAALRVLGVRPRTATALGGYFQYHPLTGWAGRPNVSLEFATQAFRGHTSHGPDGFRVIAKPLTGPAADGRPRQVIWVQGDSGTWGWGVSDGETYVDRLNQKSDEHLVFRNLGACGYSSLQEYLQLSDLLERPVLAPAGAADPARSPATQPALAATPHPARVLLLFCLNDLYENMDDQDQTPARAYCKVEHDEVVMHNLPVPPPRGINLHAWLNRHSLVYNHLYLNLLMARQALTGRGKHRGGHLPTFTPEQYRVLKVVYALERDLCRKHGIEFTPVFLSTWGPETTPELTQFVEQMRGEFLKVTRELGLQTIDLTDDIRRHFRNGGGKMDFDGDPHFNALGHRVIAEAIWAKLDAGKGPATQP